MVAALAVVALAVAMAAVAVAIPVEADLPADLLVESFLQLSR